MTGAVSAGIQLRRFAPCRALAVTAIAVALFVVGTSALSGSSLRLPSGVFSGSPAAAAESCQPPTDWQSTKAAPVPGIPSDFDLTSFDGTIIRIHWFPDPLDPGGRSHPTVLMGPGWGSPGDTDTSQAGIQGALEHRPALAGRVQRLDVGSPGLRPFGREGRGRQPERRGTGRVGHAQLGRATERASSWTGRACPGWAWSASPTEAACSSRRPNGTAVSTPSPRPLPGIRSGRVSTRTRPPRPDGGTSSRACRPPRSSTPKSPPLTTR